MEHEQKLTEPQAAATPPDNQAKPTKKTNKWLLWIAIAVVLLGAATAAVLIWKPPFLFRNTTEQSTMPTNTAPAVTLPVESPEVQKSPFVVYHEMTEHITTYKENGDIDKIVEERYILICDDAGKECNRTCYYGTDEIKNAVETREEGKLTSLSVSSPQGEFLFRGDFTYNQKGQLSAYNYCYENGIVFLECTFDDFGNMTSEIYYNKAGGLEEKNIWEYTYNTDGNITLEIYKRDTTIYSKTEYTYDAEGKLASEIQYDRNGIVRHSCTYSAGNITSDIRYTDGKIFYNYEWSYDAAGNKLSEICYNENNAVIHKYTWRYDANGNVIEHTYFSEKNGTTKTEILYDADGKKSTEIVFGENGNIQNTYTWQYGYNTAGSVLLETKIDKSGNVVEIYRYDASGNMISTICYDQNGNITEKTEWEYAVTENSRTKTEKQYYKTGILKSKTITTESRPVTYYK